MVRLLRLDTGTGREGERQIWHDKEGNTKDASTERELAQKDAKRRYVKRWW